MNAPLSPEAAKAAEDFQKYENARSAMWIAGRGLSDTAYGLAVAIKGDSDCSHLHALILAEAMAMFIIGHASVVSQERHQANEEIMLTRVKELLDNRIRNYWTKEPEATN